MTIHGRVSAMTVYGQALQRSVRGTRAALSFPFFPLSFPFFCMATLGAYH
jgi:hypothetical protein